MKKVFLACLFMFSCTLIPVSANTENEQKNVTNIGFTEDEIIDITLNKADATSNVDLSNGLNVEHSPLPFAYGDIIYDDYYVYVPARKSVNLGQIHFAYDGDRILIEWDGATQLNPQMDIVVEYDDGSQYSFYEKEGVLINKNSGTLRITSSEVGYVHIWFRSLNYSDVTFYRITTKDGAY